MFRWGVSWLPGAIRSVFSCWCIGWVALVLLVRWMPGGHVHVVTLTVPVPLGFLPIDYKDCSYEYTVETKKSCHCHHDPVRSCRLRFLCLDGCLSHVNDSPIALLIIDIWRWIHGLDFAEIDVSLAGTHIPKIEDYFVLIVDPLAVEFFI